MLVSRRRASMTNRSTTMSEEKTPAVSALRQRMIEDMTARRLCEKTQTAHIRAVRRLAKFLGRVPDTVNGEELRLPVILSREEVARLIEATRGIKYQTALSVAYGAGLRAGEVIGLKSTD